MTEIYVCDFRVGSRISDKDAEEAWKKLIPNDIEELDWIVDNKDIKIISSNNVIYIKISGAK